jgi:hypothetical protein
MAKRRRTRAKRAGAITAGTVIVLGLGAVVAGVAIYEFTKPKALPPANPAPLTPTGPGVQTVVSPPP